MYIPPHFKEQDIDALYEFIRCNPFATLIISQNGELNADHLPVLLNTGDSERHCVQGHAATANPLLPEYHDAWANYYVQFINAYEKEGIPIWGLSIQNKPMATQTWEAMIFNAEEERDFLKNNLGPTSHVVYECRQQPHHSGNETQVTIPTHAMQTLVYK